MQHIQSFSMILSYTVLVNILKNILRGKRASLPSPDDKDSDADGEKYDRDASQRDEHEVEVWRPVVAASVAEQTGTGGFDRRLKKAVS